MMTPASNPGTLQLKARGYNSKADLGHMLLCPDTHTTTFLFLLLLLESESHYVAQTGVNSVEHAGFHLAEIFLPLPPKYQDYRLS